MDARDVILRPIVSEQTTSNMALGKYVFQVAKGATKVEIKKAIEEIFKVKVTKVNTMVVPGKMRRQGRFSGMTSEWKKATVTLSEGQSIPIIEGT